MYAFKIDWDINDINLTYIKIYTFELLTSSFVVYNLCD